MSEQCEDVYSMDQVNLDDYFDKEKNPSSIPIIKSSELLNKKIYIYREKESKKIIKKMLSKSLELYGADGGNPKYIQIFENKDGDIFLSDKTYNTHSFRLISALGRETDLINNQIISEHYTISDFSDIIDLSLCKHPNCLAFFTKDGKVAFKTVEPDEAALRQKSRRDSMMSNPKIRYIYSTEDNIVHDKSCETIKSISDVSFNGSEDIPEGRSFCKRCYLNSLIRQGCGDDFKNVNLYRKFFNDGNLQINEIEKLIVKYKASIRMKGVDSLCVKCNEDSWIIKKESGQYQLFHNSYIVLEDNSRYISKNPSFHKQGSFHKLSRALLGIEDYSWEGHLAYMAEVEKAKELELKRENSFFVRLRRWLRKLVE